MMSRGSKAESGKNQLCKQESASDAIQWIRVARLRSSVRPEYLTSRLAGRSLRCTIAQLGRAIKQASVLWRAGAK